MSWIDALDDNHFLKALYPTSAPTLDALRLHEVQLHQNGPAVSLRFDLNEYPAQPLAKWQAAKSNTVQVNLIGIGVQDFAIRGWTSDNIGDLVIKDGTDGIIVEFHGNKCHMTAVFDHFRVDSVTAYRDGSRGST